MRIIHITDPHLSTLDGHSFGSLSAKRRSGYLSWTRKRHLIHRRETLERLTKAIKEEAPDLLVLSGDLVQIGLESEIAQAGTWLDDLAASTEIFFVPGNHDVYAGDSWPALRRHWGRFIPGPNAGESDGPAEAYPLVRDFDTVRMIGVSSACVTPIFSARGSLGEAQMERLSVLLRDTRASGRAPLLAIHHPPLQGMAKWRKALKEVEELQRLLSAQPPAIVCCGHLHHNLELTEGETHVFCTASASNRLDASYRIFDIDYATAQGKPGWAIRMQLKTIAPESSDGSGSMLLAEDKAWRFSL